MISSDHNQSAYFGQSKLTDFTENHTVMGTDSSFYFLFFTLQTVNPSSWRTSNFFFFSSNSRFSSFVMRLCQRSEFVVLGTNQLNKYLLNILKSVQKSSVVFQNKF